MRFCFRPMVAFLAVVALSAAAGCGGDSESAASPASIDGSGGGKGPSATDSGGSATGRPAPDPLHPVVVIDTSLGKITVRLDAEKARRTVENFLRYVDRGHYNGTIFHQVIKDYPRVVIGGAFTPELTEKEARTPIYNEARTALKNRRGTIAMARQAEDKHSATCYFFLNVTDNEVLDHKDETPEGYGYCAFGVVTDGMDVVDKIAAVEVHDKVHEAEQFERIPVQPVLIRSIQRVR